MAAGLPGPTTQSLSPQALFSGLSHLCWEPEGSGPGLRTQKGLTERTEEFGKSPTPPPHTLSCQPHGQGTSDARLTWTGRACGLRLQRCGLPLWEADVCGLGLFFGLHVSEGTCGHSPRGVVRRCPSYGAPTTGPLTLPVPARPRGLVQRGPGRVSAPHVVRGPEGEATSRASPRDARTLPLYPPQAPHQFPHLGVTWPPAARGCPPGPPGETSPQPLHGRPHTRAPSCRKPLYSGFQSLRMCRGWAPGPVPQEELVNPIKAAMADEAEVGMQVPATSPSSSLRGSCGGVGGAVPRGALLTAEQAA